ncbi:MAG: 1,4-dihydroxy-6-naphthoate synthase [Nitrospirae bacterium GWC2_57_13]|jgi:1,4-dihydroxy-6-naphthoate synthase|nr:MAG: 1,4-dihydroxy-6-naphthoate synthase [Nitrospirae bacterium GWC1_57_7]OGW28002.1 MAG: 1,4-dihydroxy-6-naphthoate synthase [Nitrospirae bacterium GWC2_57_13]OGW43022.1 MAG: 1,4-dihydroxy-6-naphthoate synthase [Nitrospirae bacterium GWD2_57_8]
MTQLLTIGFSPCPNDTFIFYALMLGKVRVPGIEFRERLEDVETLNRLALEGALDITKVSYHAVGRLTGSYALLRSGGALGRRCGPLVVARKGATLSALRDKTIAIPGELTTAALLLRLFDPALRNLQVMTYDRIMQAVADNSVAAGLIIHESRFTYPLYGLEQLLDLGEWWEQHTGLPIPLGGIVGKRALRREVLLAVETGIRESILYARTHADEVLEYCSRYAQEMDRAVMMRHIELYVNEFSLDLGKEGLAAVQRLLAEAVDLGVVPSPATPLLAENTA